VSERPSVAEKREEAERRRERRELLRERLGVPDSFLSRTDLRDLGLERRAIDAVFKAVPNILVPGYSRPLIRVGDYLRHLEAWTDRGDRVTLYSRGVTVL
jgi:hypothetical protein